MLSFYQSNFTLANTITNLQTLKPKLITFCLYLLKTMQRYGKYQDLQIKRC